MAKRLEGKAALVTGGGTGIGRAIALAFAREGASISVCGRTAEVLTDTVDAIRRDGGEAMRVVADVTIAADASRAVGETVARFGRLDVLVNNAGVRGSIATVLELTEEEWQRTFDTDAKGTWLCSRAAIPALRAAGGGSIVMISSISAHVGQPRQGCYNAAKAAQELLMKCMALDFAPQRIRVNSICPGWILTEMNREQVQAMARDPEREFPPGISYRDLLALHPLGRLGTPEDVAAAAVFLASEESSWVTGCSLFIDGGYTCR